MEKFKYYFFCKGDLAIPKDSCSENVIKPITVVGKQVNSSLKNPCASLK